MPGRILVGATSWTERTLLDSGWYPRQARTAAGRLAHYTQNFPITEVDSSYYALPSERNSELWVERTPDDFVFDVKAFSLLTHHPTPAAALPKHLQAAAGDKTRVYQRELPRSVVDEVWEMFRSALGPLAAAGRLGSVLLQFPEWFQPGTASKEYILEAAERLEGLRCAIELRQRAWMVPERNAERTLAFLAEHRLPYVCVDMPQGFPSSIPPLAAATSPELALVRFHGRDRAAWARKGGTAAERFRYRYDERELREWVPRLRSLAAGGATVHALLNNCHGDSAVRNARELADLLAAEES
ncbi:MAG: DUF72 domain-containing protein [Candidatus Binatia bacterium]